VKIYDAFDVEKLVYLCLDDALLTRRVEARHCVAVVDPGLPATMTLGQVNAPSASKALTWD